MIILNRRRLSAAILGLVYGIEADESRVHVRLTMTTPACPLGEQILRDAEERLAELGIPEVRVELVWEPAWTPELMSDEAKQVLGFA